MSRNALPPATWVAIILSAIGAINWGLVGLFDFNLVSALFGPMSTVSRIIYVVIGLSGLYLLFAAATMESRTTAPPPRSTL
jgi:uncharacterized protein